MSIHLFLFLKNLSGSNFNLSRADRYGGPEGQISPINTKTHKISQRQIKKQKTNKNKTLLFRNPNKIPEIKHNSRKMKYK